MSSIEFPEFYFSDLVETVSRALAEDIGLGDLTAGLISPKEQALAQVFCRETAIICGRPWVDEVFHQIDKHLSIEWLVEEGQSVTKDTLIFRVQGNAAHILTAERTALNFLQTLSGTATQTASYIQAMGSTQTKLLDTRKTLPGLRLAQKYAVACGGGTNHRIGLYDAILIKENHIMSAGGITQAVQTAQKMHPGVSIEVETENLTELQEALDAQANIVMLDNFTLPQIAEAVALNKHHATPAKLEVSGNVEHQNLPGLVKTGVDFISTGALTKHVQAIDFSMRFKFKE